MERGKGGNQKSTPKGRHGGGGSIHDWQWVKSQFLEGLRLLRESFSIDASKQCHNRLGVGFVLRHK
jgi:hypothetical protein